MELRDHGFSDQAVHRGKGLPRKVFSLIVNAIRNLYTERPVGNDIWIAVAWYVGILIVAYFFAAFTYCRKIS